MADWWRKGSRRLWGLISLIRYVDLFPVQHISAAIFCAIISLYFWLNTQQNTNAWLLSVFLALWANICRCKRCSTWRFESTATSGEYKREKKKNTQRDGGGKKKTTKKWRKRASGSETPPGTAFRCRGRPPAEHCERERLSWKHGGWAGSSSGFESSLPPPLRSSTDAQQDRKLESDLRFRFSVASQRQAWRRRYHYGYYPTSHIHVYAVGIHFRTRVALWFSQ